MKLTSLNLARLAKYGFLAILVAIVSTSNAFAVLLRVAGPSLQSQDQPYDHLEKGTAAFQNNDYVEAEKQLQQAMQGASALTRDEIAQGELMLAKIYWNTGKADKAVDYVEEALKYGDTVEMHYLLASIYAGQGKVKPARSEVDLVIAAEPSNPDAYDLKGRIAFSSGERDEALVAYQKALSYTEPTSQEYVSRQSRIEALKKFALYESEAKELGYIHLIPTNRPELNYPEEARKLKIQGIVSAVCLVDEQGVVKEVYIGLSPGHGMSEEATRAAYSMRYTPATKNGVPVKVWTRVEFEFNLR
jgi:TonB family protein